jgi:transcriptional regulator with XRE-family HTH domain
VSTEGIPAPPAPNGSAWKNTPDAIRLLIKVRRVTHRETAQALDLSPASFSQRLVGEKTTRITVEELCRLAEFFGVEPRQLLLPLPVLANELGLSSSEALELLARSRCVSALPAVPGQMELAFPDPAFGDPLTAVPRTA